MNEVKILNGKWITNMQSNWYTMLYEIFIFREVPISKRHDINMDGCGFSTFQIGRNVHIIEKIDLSDTIKYVSKYLLN